MKEEGDRFERCLHMHDLDPEGPWLCCRIVSGGLAL